MLSALKSNQSEFIAVYGRRRIGKTFLIRETFLSVRWFFIRLLAKFIIALYLCDIKINKNRKKNEKDSWNVGIVAFCAGLCRNN